MIKLLIAGLLTVCSFICIVAIIGGFIAIVIVRNNKTKKNTQSKEIINMFTPKEDTTKISEYEKYFDTNESTYKGW